MCLQPVYGYNRLELLPGSASFPSPFSLCSTVVFFLRLGTFAVSVTVCVAELKLEATNSDDVTIPFKTAELERADQVKITFTRDSQKKLIAQYCCAHCWVCIPVETPGVLLRIEEGTASLILQDVSSRSSGLYEAQVFNGKHVSEIQATLVVKEPALSSTKEPPQISTPKPPDTSGHLWLCALLILPVLGVVYFFWRKKCRREREALPDAEGARETPAVSSTASANCTDCVAVSFNTCRENTDDLLVDT